MALLPHKLFTLLPYQRAALEQGGYSFDEMGDITNPTLGRFKGGVFPTFGRAQSNEEELADWGQQQALRGLRKPKVI